MLLIPSLPHIVIWTCGPGLGSDVVAALAVHPVEVSEVRDMLEAQRVAAGRPAQMVVLIGSNNVNERIAQIATVFPGLHILLLTDSTSSVLLAAKLANVSITEVSISQPLTSLCWYVLETLCQTIRTRGESFQHLGPMLVSIDAAGIVDASTDLKNEWFYYGDYPQPGESIIPLLVTEDREMFTQHLRAAELGAVCFFPIRIMNGSPTPHLLYVGMRSIGNRLKLILQPLIDSAPIIGRRRGTRDPITGLIDRWELWREMQEESLQNNESSFVVFAKLDAFESIATSMSFRAVDDIFDRVASAISRVFPWPATPSRLSGGAFLVLIKNSDKHAITTRATRLIHIVNRIGGIGVFDKLRFSMSIGICEAGKGNYDLAVRLAEISARDARFAGGNRVVVANSEESRLVRLQDLWDSMETRTWNLWLQPVVSHVDGQPKFYEALARFGSVQKPKITRPDFFAANDLDGALQRFDHMVLLQSIAMLKINQQLRISLNITQETFAHDAFPQIFLDLLQDSAIATNRIIVEISPACLSLPPSIVDVRMQRLSEAGVAVALDDFGSGICSMRHLTEYPVAIVKLDELVTSYIADDPLQRNFVRMVVNLCRARGILVVAEFTRSLDQMERLAADGVDLFQGELIGMPQAMPGAPLPPEILPSHILPSRA